LHISNSDTNTIKIGQIVYRWQFSA